MSSKPRVAVIGAGIGGATAAGLLQKAGYPCRIYEQAPNVVRIGAGINLAPNSTRILRGMGLEPALFQAGIRPRLKFSREGDTGKLLFTIETDALERLYDAPFIALHRGDLQHVLTSPLGPDTITLGKRLLGIEEAPGALKLRFEDGTAEEADIVIGGDGINSRVRDFVQGARPLLYHGAVAYRAIFPTALLGGMEVADNTKWWGPDRFVLVYFMSETRDEVYFITGSPEPWPREDYTAIDADLSKMRATFADFHPDIRRMMEVCPAANMWPILERDPYPVWSKGNVVLLGDACHPTTPFMGQGAGLAIEDAAVLVRCIEAFGGADMAVAFQTYAAHRYQRTSRVQLESRKNEWTRTSMDHQWLYGYDATTVPLNPSLAA